MTWRCSCSASGYRPCSCIDINENAEHAGGIHVILAGFAEAAEQRAPHIGFAFADPALLHLGPPFQRERPVRRPFQLCPSAGLLSHCE